MPTLRTLRRAPAALLTALALLALPALPACEKKSDSITPDAGGEQTGGLDLLYKAAAVKLKQDAKMTLKISGMGQSGEMSADVTGLLDVSDAAGKLKVAFTVAEVRTLDISESMRPKPKEGEPAPDLKAKLQAASGARVVDLRGKEDEAASKSLPENAAKDKKNDEDVSMAASFLGLPSLPDKPLVEGSPVKVKKQEPEKMPFGGEIEMDTETTFTLVKIDSSSGKRLAEVKFESESSGANEFNQGGRSFTVSLDVSAEGTLVFDLDAQLPVRSSIKSTQVISAGEQGESEFQYTLESTYAPA